MRKIGRPHILYNLYRRTPILLFHARFSTLEPSFAAFFLLPLQGGRYNRIHHVPGDCRECFGGSQRAGGLGGSWTSVRGTGSYIAGTNGESQGVIPFLKMHNDQLWPSIKGDAKGSVILISNPEGVMFWSSSSWQEHGDDRRRTHDMNTANWICDLFRADVGPPGLDLVQKQRGRVARLLRLNDSRTNTPNTKPKPKREKFGVTRSALDLWKQMLKMLFER